LNTLSTIILSVGLAALTAVVPLYQDSSNSQEMGSNLRNNTQLVYEPYLYQNKGLNLENKEDLKSLIRQEAERYNIDANLVLEIVRRESNFNPKICNQQYGCIAGQGLFMIIPSTEKMCERHFGREMDMFDVWDNIDCAMWLLTKGDLKSLIRQEAERYNIDADLMIRIAWCESRIRMIDSGLGDYGIYQFRLSTWEYFTRKFNLTNFDINNPLDQIELAARIISEGGLHHWNSSRSCWQR